MVGAPQRNLCLLMNTVYSIYVDEQRYDYR